MNPPSGISLSSPSAPTGRVKRLNANQIYSELSPSQTSAGHSVHVPNWHIQEISEQPTSGKWIYAIHGKLLQFFRPESRPLYSSKYKFYYARRFSELVSVEEVAAVDFAVKKLMGLARDKTVCVPFVRRIKNLPCFLDLCGERHNASFLFGNNIRDCEFNLMRLTATQYVNVAYSTNSKRAISPAHLFDKRDAVFFGL
jgi:hypothetical protein